MRFVVLAVVALIAALPGVIDAGQSLVTVVATGPAYAARGSTVTYDVDVRVDDGPEAFFYITWQGTPKTGRLTPLCCDLLEMSVISGQANSLDPSHDFSKRWTIFAPGATFRVDIKIDETTEFEGLAVGGYLPGTDVAQFEAVTPALTTITALPATGGPPPALAGNARHLALAGAALILAAAACVVVARRVRTGDMP